MINLPHPYYAPVYFDCEDLFFEYLDPKFLGELQRNAAYVAFVESKEKDERFFSQHERIKEFENSEYFNIKVPLNKLGIKVVMPEDSILTAAQSEKLYNSPWVVTDRYFYPFGHRHIGSSRHGLLYNCQLKGIGRNGLTHRGDYIHSWGGYGFMSAMTSLLNNIYIDQRSALGTLPIWALGRYKKLTVWHEEQSPAVMVRDARAYRLAHFEPASPQLKIISKLMRDQLEAQLGESELPKIKKKLLTQYTSYVRHGINPRAALIPENILFDGRTIDTEEYDIHLSRSPVVTLAVKFTNVMPKEEFLKLDSQKVAQLFFERKLEVYGDSLGRNFGAWKMHSGILDELYEQDKDFAGNRALYLEAMRGELAPPIFELLESFLEPNPSSISPSLRFIHPPARVYEILQNMHLVSGEFAAKTEEQIYYLSFSEDPKALRWNDLSAKLLRIFMGQPSLTVTPEEAMANFESLKEGLLNQIRINSAI